MAAAAAAAPKLANIVQYVVVRKDLAKSFPLGALLAQSAHACVAAVWQSREAPATVAYCAPAALDAMHKVVLAVDSAEALAALAAALTAASVPHKLWIEQPENDATCLATAPGAREELAPHFAALKLLR